MNEAITHKELVEKAKFWLQSAKGCNPVFAEKGSSKTEEMPDAIGWNANDCIVVECKVSVQDLKADNQKPFRKDGRGMGSLRYYLLPYDLYESAKDKHDFNGFGIVCTSENRRTEQLRRKDSTIFERNILAECYYLRSRILEIQRFGR